MLKSFRAYKVSFWGLSISLCLGLSACSDALPKTYSIGFSQCTMADSWRKNMVEGMARVVVLSRNKNDAQRCDGQ